MRADFLSGRGGLEGSQRFEIRKWLARAAANVVDRSGSVALTLRIRGCAVARGRSSVFCRFCAVPPVAVVAFCGRRS
eukprot:11187360-Lingulodinium_polyedra.AAC.1